MATSRFSSFFAAASQRPSWAVLAMVLVLGWSVLALRIHQEYRDTQESARQTMEQQVKFAQAHLSRQLQITAHALDTVRKAPWLKHPDAINPIEANAELKNMAALLTGVRSLLVVNAKGKVIASNRMELLGQDMLNSDRYQAISKNPHPDLLYLSAPFLTPLNHWAMGAGKMLVKGEHEFNGYVLAILDPSYFQSMMQAILYTDDTRATLVHNGGKVVMRQPDSEALAGQDVSARPGNLFKQFKESGKERAMVEGVSAATGKSVLLMFTTIRPEFTAADNALFFGVSREAEKILEPWWQHTTERLLMALIASALAISALHNWPRQRRDKSSKPMTR